MLATLAVPQLAVNTRGVVSFTNTNSYSYEFPNFRLHVEKLNNDVARVWFSDHQRNAIPVPPNTFQLDGNGAVHNDFNGSFYLTWIGSHTIAHNNIPIFTLNNQRQVSVHSTCEHWEVRDGVGRVVRRDGQRVPLAPVVAPQMVFAVVGNALPAPNGQDDENDDEE